MADIEPKKSRVQLSLLSTTKKVLDLIRTLFSPKLLTETLLRREFAPYRRKAGTRGFTPHCLRTGAGSRAQALCHKGALSSLQIVRLCAFQSLAPPDMEGESSSPLRQGERVHAVMRSGVNWNAPCKNQASGSLSGTDQILASRSGG